MPITIAVIVYLCLSLQGYLNYYRLKQTLPYSFGFSSFLQIERLLILINSVYLLGWLWGIVTFVALLLGARVITFPVSFLCYCMTQSEMEKRLVGERPNLLLYGGWSLLVVVLGVLTVVNFFISPFGTGLDLITSWATSLSKPVLLIGLAVLSLIIYLFIGLLSVAKDYSGSVLQRPGYAVQKNVKFTIFKILFWPVLLIIRKLMNK